MEVNQIIKITLAWELFESGVPKSHISGGPVPHASKPREVIQMDIVDLERCLHSQVLISSQKRWR